MRRSLVALLTMALMGIPAAAMSTDHSDTARNLGPHPGKATSPVSDSLQRAVESTLGNGLNSDPTVAVKILAKLTPAEMEALVSGLGGRLELSIGDEHWADLPVSALAAIAANREVDHVTTPEVFDLLGDTSEGVATMGTSTWTGDSLSGQGVKVGIIDAGFDGYQAAIASGDLPGNLVTKNYCPNFEGSVHGTGVAEIVHDVAPDAELYLICMDSFPDLVDAVSYAKNNGIDVINHSIGWRNSSRGDGSGGPNTPEGVAGDAIDSGIVWVNSSGNSADQHWKGRYDDASNDGFHEFDPGLDETNAFLLGHGQTVVMTLKWDSWPTTSLDYDLFLFDHGSQSVVAGSVDTQNGNDPPTEMIEYQNLSGSTQVLGAAIDHFSGSGNPRMDLFINVNDFQYQEPASSIIEPAGHPDVVTVGATCWDDDKLAFYSSRGPNIAGHTKPDVTGPTGVSTSAYGAGNANCTAGFTGTSASSPHVAGMAALILDGDPSLSPDEVSRRLEANIIDLGGSGKDNKFGAGRLEAFGLCDGEVPSMVGTDGNDTLVGTSKPDVIAGYGGNDLIKGRNGSDLLCGGDGDDDIRGDKGHDEMRGEDGDDTLTGALGNDRSYGGPGENTASFKNSATAVFADLSAESATGEGNDTLKAIANVVGSSHDDTLIGDDGRNTIEGRDGKDTIEGAGGKDNLKGGNGSDVIKGDDGSDTVRGQKGHDRILGGGGWDLIFGGPGNDDLRGGNGTDTLSYEDADAGVTVDLLSGDSSGGGGLDVLSGFESLLGSGFADLLKGDDAANTIKGRNGNDDIRGRGGDDDLHGEGGTDTGHGGPGTDVCATFESTTACE